MNKLIKYTLVLIVAATIAGCGGGGGNVSMTSGTAENSGIENNPNPSTNATVYFEQEIIANTFPIENFHTNDYESIEAFGSTYLVMVGGKTNTTTSQASDYLDSYARILKINNRIFTATDSKLNVLSTLTNQPQSIQAFDMNGDGIKDIIIGAFGPDVPSLPGAKDIVLESNPNGWSLASVPNINYPTESVAAGKIGNDTFFYSSSQLCGVNNYSPYLTIKSASGYSATDSLLPDFMRAVANPGTCGNQEFIGSFVLDIDGDGHDDLILGSADDAGRVSWPNYVGGQILFGNGTDFRGRRMQLPPTRFDVNGVRNTTVQYITAKRLWNNDVYILLSYYQSNVLGNPAIGGGIQLIKYTNGQLVDVTSQVFVGYSTFNSTGVDPYSYGGPFNMKFVDVNGDGCLDIVTSRKPGLWVNDCSGKFVWAYSYISNFINSDRLFYYKNGSQFGFVTPSGGEEGGVYKHLKPITPIPTPRNGIFN